MSTDGNIIRRYRQNNTNYYAHIFTNSGTLTLSGFSGSTNVEYLIVAGGGGGGGGIQSGWNGAGGGAGGVRFGQTNMTAIAYTITVGAGGLGCLQGTPTDGTNGNPSSISGSDVAVDTHGGGRGASMTLTPALSGGSGGGGVYNVANANSVKGAGELGNNGGAAAAIGNGWSGSGGGGAGAPGQQAPGDTTPGVGGAGTNLSFSGLLVEYARGGTGSTKSQSNDGVSGTSNTGNGGNGGVGSGKKGGNGGSGIVIVRYADTSAFSATVTVTSATAVWPFQPGAFTISRPADATTNSEMTVTYTLTGTATNGTDYAAAPATNNLNIVGVSSNVTFGVGVTSIVVNLYPLNNPLTAARTATLTLVADGNPSANVTFPVWSLGTRVTASGGNVTNYPFAGGTNWNAHIFTNVVGSTNFTIASGGQVEYLTVAGGGGGGGNGSSYNGGGGGAGGVRFGALTLPAGTYAITVGDGGAGNSSGAAGANGSPSILGGSNGIAVVGTTGGGLGGIMTGARGQDGGSGGGGIYSGGNGVSVKGAGELGNDGGASLSGGWSGSGGGGAGAGASGQVAPNSSTPGVGGSGTNLSFSGVLVEYAKGGKGGKEGPDVDNGVAGTATRGNGGNGGYRSAGGGAGGKGGSGIVIVRYLVPPALGASLTPTNNQTFVSETFISPVATVSNGVPPYSVSFYTNSASGAFGLATNLSGSGSAFTNVLGVLPDSSTNGIYVVVTDSGNPVSTYTTATNTFYVSATPNFEATIENRAPTAVTPNSATLNGYLVNVGRPTSIVYVVYGPTNGVWTSTNAVSAPLGGWTNGAPASANVGGLAPDRTYYYTFAASNTAAYFGIATPVTNFITGLVTVEATGANAQYGGVNGAFTLRRPVTCTNEALTVTYTLGGSASNGVDYTLSPSGTSQTFAAGVTSLVVTLTAVFDAETTNEQAVLTLGAGAYATGASNSASVTILPAGTPASWVADGNMFQRRYRENGTNFVACIFTNSAHLAAFSNTVVNYLVVAGGGGGGGTYEGGGGGAGGVRFGRTNMTAGTTYTITVGAGGLGYGQGVPNDGTNGNPSSISGSDVAVNSTGGGRGGSSGGVPQGLNGGSGGGGAYSVTYGNAIGGSGELGNNGGAGGSGVGNGAGGGGARSPGQSNPSTGGGSGTNLTFSGIAVEYAVGGTGGIRANNLDGADAVANRGYGGGGGGNNSGGGKGGHGGSGIVIVRYEDSAAFSPTVTVTAATAVWPFQVGAFTISRPADANTNTETTVNYTLTGSATNGVDYAAAPATNNLNIVSLPGYVTFGVGVTSIVVNLYPLYNPLTVARTATLTLAADGNPSAAVNFPAWSAGALVTATGGTLTNYPAGGGNTYNAHIFTNVAGSANFTITRGGVVEYLAVAGGGGGGGNGNGFNGAGGGAGGVRFGALTLPAGTYAITVGDGGAGNSSGAAGANGSPSILGGSNGIAVVGTTGGGLGGIMTGARGQDGGSGGGGIYSGGNGVSVKGAGELGNDGGASLNNGWSGSGGGGAGAPGQQAPDSNTPGVGGSGTNLIFSGVSVEYAKGGKGGKEGTDVDNGVAGTATRGNGGNGGYRSAGGAGGKGGSGIVIVRYIVSPDIDVRTNNAILADGGTNDFGKVRLGTTNTVSMTITNSGTAPLTLNTNIVIGGNAAAQFSLVSLGTNVLQVGQTTTVVVDCAPTNAGGLVATMQITNDAGYVTNKNPYDITLKAQGITPNIDVLTNGAVLANNGTNDFGNVLAGTATSVVLRITNSGTATLNLSTLWLGGANPSHFSFGAPGTNVLQQGESTTLAVTSAPTAGGSLSAVLHITNDASFYGKNPYNITLTAQGLTPDIVVWRTNGTLIAVAGTNDFGNVRLGTTTFVPLVITNSGTAALTLNTNILIDGTAAAQFYVASLGTNVLQPNQTTTLVVACAPTNVAELEAVLHITNNAVYVNGKTPYYFTLTATGISPNIDVRTNGAVLAHGGTYDFGNVLAGTATSAVLRITNSGTATLNLSTIVKDGANASQFSFGAPGTNVLQQGESTTLAVTSAPTAGGSLTATLHITNDASFYGKNPYTITLTAQGLTPDIAVLRTNGTPIAVGGTNDFGSVPWYSTNVAILTITNKGSAPLTLGGIATQGLSSVFTLGAPGTNVLGTNAFTTLAVTCMPTAATTYYGSLHITNNAIYVVPGKNPYDITLQVTGLEPEIGVQEPAGVDLTSGVSTSAFGVVNVGYSSAPKTYYVTNSGRATLMLAGVTMGGPNSDDFALNTNDLPASLAAGAGTTFTVTFEPVTSGVRTASLSISNNDFDESAFTIGLTGIASNSPLGPFGATNVTVVGEDLHLNLHGKAGRTYLILSSNDAAQIHTLVGTIVPQTNSFTFIDSNVVGNAAITSLYYQVAESNSTTGAWTTNPLVWALENRDNIGPNKWHLLTGPVDYGDSNQNTLAGELGRQLAGGLIPGNGSSAAPTIWLWDYAANKWTNFWLFTDHKWYADGGTQPADLAIEPGRGFWLKSYLTDSSASNTVFIGLTHTNSMPVQMITNRWMLFAWPYATPGLESQGWKFLEQGGHGGTSADNADNIFMQYNGRSYLLWLRSSDSRWCIQNTTNTVSGISLNNRSAYFYYARNTNFWWKATQ